MINKQALQKLISKAKFLAFHSPLYSLSLMGEESDQILVIPHDPWPGDKKTGSDILAGIYEFSGYTIYADDGFHWFPDKAPKTWLNYAHSFHWLRDLREVSNENARRYARLLIKHWFNNNPKWNTFSSAPDVIAKRIYNLISLYNFYAPAADEDFTDLLHKNLFKQIRHLTRLDFNDYYGNELITILRGLLFGLVNLSNKTHLLKDTIKTLEQALPTLINAEGSHHSRNPTAHIELMRLLIDIKNLFMFAHLKIPKILDQTIQAMTPVTKLFIASDGKLHLFNGSWEMEEAYLAIILSQISHKSKMTTSFPLSGYERVYAGRSSLILDTGHPPLQGYDRWAHAGTLSFELTVNKNRLIVNCGHPKNNDEIWDRALCSTAAHSTLVVEDTNSSEVLDKSIGKHPHKIDCFRVEDDKYTHLELSHDGYFEKHQIIHKRRLSVHHSGYDIKGEDILVSQSSKKFSLHFHLHPKVRASVIQDGKGALLHLPSGPGWRMSIDQFEFTLEPSLYYGSGKELIKSTQLVIYGETSLKKGNQTKINWILQTVPR